MENNQNNEYLEIMKKKQEKKQLINGCAGMIGIAVVVTFLIIMVFDCGGDKKPEKKYEPDMTFDATVMARGYVEMQVRNPATAEFDRVETTKSNQVYTTTGMITAQNDFGVKKRSNFNVVLKWLGNTEEDEEKSMDGSMWELINIDLY